MKITTENIVKIYKNRKVVDEVSLDVGQGEVVGLLGPNGAGKTTSFYMIVGLVQPNKGKVYLNNKEIYINDLIIYPNPSNDIFNIMFNSYTKQDINLTIHNILGEVIISETLRSFSGDYIRRINMSQYPNAIYILKLTTNNGMINKKLTLE